MPVKKIVSIALLLFAAFSIVFVIVQSVQDAGNPEVTVGDLTDEEKSALITKPDADADVVYYFMTSMRCSSCMKIERYTKEAVDTNFGKELGDGSLVWRMVEIDSPENEHFIGEYELVTKSVVLVKIRNGEQVSWRNLDQVWTLLNDKQEFMDYINGEVRGFLETSS